MSFTAITADINIMRSQNLTEFQNYTDNQLTALNRVPAQNILKSDIIAQIALKETDLTTVIDDLAVSYANTLTMALTYKQLEIYWFERQDGGLDSMSVVRMDYYQKNYNTLAKSFKTFELDVDKKRSKTVTLRVG